MNRNQWIFLHPDQRALHPRTWRTVAWNAAWLAADAVDDREAPRTITDITPQGRVVRRRRAA